jgi:hypothetical protein
MSQRYDVMTPRPWTDRDGNEKTSWTRVGTMFETKNGFSIALDALPIPTMKDGKLECRLVCFPPKEKDDAPRGGSRPPAPELDDQIPFSPER